MTAEWEHPLAGESARAFAAFCAYRDMPASERSIARVHQTHIKTASKSKRWLAEWSRRFAWVERAAGYDAFLDSVKREAAREAIVEMATRQAEEGMALQEKGLKRLQQMPLKSMSASDAIRAMEVGVRIERLARGEPAEITRGHFTIRPAADLTDDELAQVIAAGQLTPSRGGRTEDPTE